MSKPTTHAACGQSDQITTCGDCLGSWCDRCDPAHGPLCPWCHGRGYSTAAISAPLYRRPNHTPQGTATAGNNRRVHVVRDALPDYFLTVCGARTPRRPQSTQVKLEKCGRCYR